MNDENREGPFLHDLILRELWERELPAKFKFHSKSRLRGGDRQEHLEINVGCPPLNRRIWVHFKEDDTTFVVRMSGEDRILIYNVAEPDSLDRFFNDIKTIYDHFSAESWTKR